MAQAQQRAAATDSLRAYQAERQQATTAPAPPITRQERRDPVFTSATQGYGRNPNTYLEQRRTYYSGHQERYPQLYTVNQGMRPNYGIFDSNFLTGMVLGVVGTSLFDRATWMASQQNQPWYAQYRSDLERQARENSELRDRLSELDAEIARIRSQGMPREVTALPAGVPAAAAIAPEAVLADENSQGGLPWLWIFIAVGVLLGGTWIMIRKLR